MEIGIDIGFVLFLSIDERKEPKENLLPRSKPENNYLLSLGCGTRSDDLRQVLALIVQVAFVFSGLFEGRDLQSVGFTLIV